MKCTIQWILCCNLICELIHSIQLKYFHKADTLLQIRFTEIEILEKKTEKHIKRSHRLTSEPIFIYVIAE